MNKSANNTDDRHAKQIAVDVDMPGDLNATPSTEEGFEMQLTNFFTLHTHRDVLQKIANAKQQDHVLALDLNDNHSHRMARENEIEQLGITMEKIDCFLSEIEGLKYEMAGARRDMWIRLRVNMIDIWSRTQNGIQ